MKYQDIIDTYNNRVNNSLYADKKTALPLGFIAASILSLLTSLFIKRRPSC